MPSDFDLVITADYPNRTAELRLLDGHGSQLAFRETDFKKIAVSRQQGLFDLRNYLKLYVESGQEAARAADIGVCIAEEVLGEEIFRALWRSEAQRTLRIELPGATEEENYLAAALARVPWEIARPAEDKATLAKRHLLVRVVHDREAPPTKPLDLAGDDNLRVLFVFAEAPGSRPLAARRERQQLRRLFEKEIYPKRRVVADFLAHGVTRKRLKEQIEDRGGYHVIHWSGHGHLNLLELSKTGGGKDRLSGGDLLDLCGGFIPRLVFLSACHSGDILRVKDWNDFLAVAEGREPGAGAAGKETRPGDEKDIPLDEQPGYTGTAHALLERGVPSVVAMRYAVGDEYARDLGVEFYRALLAHTTPKTAAAALTLARQSLVDRGPHDLARYDVCDHATPVLYGAAQPGLTLPAGRSPALDTRDPRLHRIAELTPREHEYFVGRTWQLAGLGSDFIGPAADDEVKPIAVVTGLGGMGKTALAAEALSLWASRFTWVLLYQAKPNALSFDAFLRDVHMKLYGELGRYHEWVKTHRADEVFRAPEEDFTGPERQERLTRNLVRALRDEPILLVIDNFETNLKPDAEPTSESGEPVWACQDPAWDHCLATLATELAGTPSRVLITCRRPLAALAEVPCHRVLLGPLPAGEAALYLRSHAELSQLTFSADEDERDLARRLMEASRFHPLLMNRLAHLATGGPSLRPQLMAALEALEKRDDYAQLPALFARDAADKEELAYLSDALATSLDGLIEGAGSEARRVLWMIAVANEPVALELLEGAWSGESHEQEQLRQMKQMLDMLPMLPPELQEKLKAIPPELRAMLDALPPEAPAQPELEPLLSHLVAVGLLTEERAAPDDANPALTCHELVRERIRAWMAQRPQDRGELTENDIRLAYAERLEATFEALLHQDMTAALEAGSRALVYCVQAEAWDRLGGFASRLVTSTGDPRLLAGLLPHLEAAADAAPEGKRRWSCLTYLADALRLGGRPDASLQFYEQAATQARTVAEAGGENARQAWSDLASITGNWAIASRYVGDLDASRQRHLDSADAEREAGNPAINSIGSELEALRIDIMQGKAEDALAQVEERLDQVEAWWQQHRASQPAAEAPDAEVLARAFISALDIANDASRAQQDWESALRRTDGVLRVKRALERPAEDIASTRMNRAVELGMLRRFGEAKTELEACLKIFENDPTRRARTLSSLADLFNKQGDVAHAINQERRALALLEQLPDPRDRAISHNHLANYLERRGTQADLAESSRHQLAALVYFLVAGIGQYVRTLLDNYAIRFRRARSEGVTLTVPRVADLLAESAFRPLDDWLRGRQVDTAEVQAAVDQVLEQARQAASLQE